VQIRYTRTLSKRWGWTTSAGFEYSLKSSQSSYEQDLAGVEYDLATDLLKRTNKNSSHYALLGLRLNYHFSKKIHFNIGVQSKYAISDLYNDAAFQKRYFLPGVTSGLIINF